MTPEELRDYPTSGEHFNKSQLEDIFKYLKDNAKLGKFSSAIAKDLYPKSLFEHLKTLGYKVELISDNRDGDYYNIDWSK